MTLDDPRRLAEVGGERIQGFAFAISMFVGALLCAVFAAEMAAGGDRCDVELESRINPNDAPVASLVRLSGVGVSRAAAIVAYRDGYRQQEGDRRAFRDCNDLQNVKGIGPITAQNNRRLLKFE